MRLASAVATIAGVLAMYISLFYRRADAPMIGSTDPNDKILIGKHKSRYRGPGFSLLIGGIVLWTAGVLNRLAVSVR